MNGTLYRAAKRDRNGDAIDADGNVTRIGGDGTLVGTISGLIMGAASVNSAQAVASTSGQIGVRRDQFQPRQGDTLLTDDGVRYRVGPAQWGRPHSLTDSLATARYRWFEVTALTN